MPFDRLYIRSGGKAYGPFTIEQIGQAILSRRLTPSHEVSPDGETWFAAGTIWNEIRPEVPPPPDLDDSPRGRRRRAGDERERRADDNQRRESGGHPRSALPPPPAAPPARPQVPPLPRPVSGSSPGSAEGGGRPGDDLHSGGSAEPPDTVAVPKIDSGRTRTQAEIVPTDPGGRSDVRRRRRSSSHGTRYAGAGGAGAAGSVAGADAYPTLRSLAVRVALGLLVVASLLHLVADAYLFSVLSQFRDYLAELRFRGTPPAAAELDETGQAYGAVIDTRYELRRVALAAEAGIWVLSAALFLAWKHGVNLGLRQAGVKGLLFTPGGCVGWYFVPIAGLFKPYQAMRELWLAADPYPYDRRRSEASGVVSTWWALWIFGGIAATAGWFWIRESTRELDRVAALFEQLRYEPFLIALGIAETAALFVLVAKLSGRLAEKAVSDAAYEKEQ